MLRRSTIFRLAAFNSLAFAVVALVLGLIVYNAVRGDLRSELDQRITAEQDALLREQEFTGRAMAELVDARSQHGARDMFYALVDGRGQRLAGAGVERLPAEGWSSAQFRDRKGKIDDARASTARLASGQLLIVGADPESIENLDERIVPLLAMVFGLIALIGIGGGFLMSAMIRRRLDAITDTAEAIIGGDLARRVTVGARSDEFDRLSATLNRMLDRIDGLMANLRQVSSDVAHDLRTPLTRLRQKLEVGMSRQDVASLRGAINEAIDRTDDLLELFTAILSISEVEAGSALNARRFDLSLLVSDIAESYLPAAEDAQRTLRHSLASGLAIDGQRELVAQLLVNLLDNALRHTPPMSAIEVSLGEVADGIELTVSDNGPGIAPEDRQRVFERFVRLDRSRSTPGHGLGLRLVAAIAKAHNATIALQDNNPGVRMIIRFRRSGQ